jgi:hypothetical protein
MAGKLTITDFLTIADSMAVQAAAMAAFTSDGYANNRATILAEADLVVDGFLGEAFGVDPVPDVAKAFASRIAALRANLGDLSAFLLANDKRVSAVWNTILGARLTPASIMAPAMSGANKLGHFAALTATTGTFTDGLAVDKTLYGKAWLQLVMTHDIAGSLVATIVGKKYDGTSQSKAVTLTGHSNSDIVPVGTTGLSGDNFQDVTGVTITGGTAADAFDIEVVAERTPSL